MHRRMHATREKYTVVRLRSSPSDAAVPRNTLRLSNYRHLGPPSPLCENIPESWPRNVSIKEEREQDAARNFRSGRIVIQSSHVHSLRLWFHLRDGSCVDYAWSGTMEEREREKSAVVERDFTFGSRKLSEGSRDRNPLITRNRFYRLPRVNTRRHGGERVGRGREEKRGERERGRRPSSVRGGGPERSLIIRWEWRERSSLFLR